MSRIALVTGGNRGIGLEVCRQLAMHDHIVLLGARSLEKGQQAAALLTLPTVRAVQLDVNDQASIENVYTLVNKDYGHLNVLVNNAAIHYDSWQNVLTADLNTVQEAVNTNTLGPWRMCQTFVPLLRRSQHGRIVNVTSGAGHRENLSGGTPAYSLSKAALNALTIMFANHLQGDGILVNAVGPGWTATDMGGRGGRPVAEGAAGVVWAATLPDDGPTGTYSRDGNIIDW